MLVYDMLRQVEDKEIVETIWQTNFKDMEFATFESEFKIIFMNGPSAAETVNWVVEVSPEVRGKLRDRGRLFMMWISVKLVDFVAVSRCYRCQRFGHRVKNCKSEAETCGHCAENCHSFDAS